jgi:hypothetical protein
MIVEIAEEMREMPFIMTEFHGDRPLFVPPYRAKPERHGSLFLRTASAGQCGAARLLGRRGRRAARAVVADDQAWPLAVASLTVDSVGCPHHAEVPLPSGVNGRR